MNCREFRRRLTIDPLCREPDLLEHETRCADCAPFARGLRADEIRMRGLLRDVRPPDGMAGRVRSAALRDRRAETRRHWQRGAAAAAMIALGAGVVGLYQGATRPTDGPLAASVIAHIEDEPGHLHAAGPVPAGRVDLLFRVFGAEVTADIGPVHFAAACPMRSRNGVHLVLPGAIGPVTVLFMPGETAGKTAPVRSARFDGRIVPTGWGSIAVVGERGERLEGIGERMAAAVRWPRARSASGLAGVGPVVGVAARQQQDG